MPVANPQNLIKTPETTSPDERPDNPTTRGGGWFHAFRQGKWRALRWLVYLVVLSIAGACAYRVWGHFQTFETTDDAEVDAHITALSPRISGTVRAVRVEDNQEVRAGQTLIEIDPRDFQVAVDQARAALAAAVASVAAQQQEVPIASATTVADIVTTQQQIQNGLAGLSGAERDHAAAVANVREAEANQVRAAADLARYKTLVDKDEVSRQQYDLAAATARAADARVEAMAAAAQAMEHQVEQRRAMIGQAQARFVEAQANAPSEVSGRKSQVAAATANVREAQARLEQALLNLSYCTIAAPVAGIVGRRTAEVGNRVQSGDELLYLTQLDDIWVTANFKETQFRKMRAGQRAEVSVDALGGRRFEGAIESTPGATGARFSLLPPENATGNYVKVVQRLPIRIRLTPGQDSARTLRPGMSVGAKVWVHDGGN